MLRARPPPVGKVLKSRSSLSSDKTRASDGDHNDPHPRCALDKLNSRFHLTHFLSSSSPSPSPLPLPPLRSLRSATSSLEVFECDGSLLLPFLFRLRRAAAGQAGRQEYRKAHRTDGPTVSQPASKQASQRASSCWCRCWVGSKLLLVLLLLSFAISPRSCLCVHSVRGGRGAARQLSSSSSSSSSSCWLAGWLAV